MRSLLSMYGWRFPITLLALLQHHDYKVLSFWREFWHTNDFLTVSQKVTLRSSSPVKALLVFLYVVAAVEASIGGYMVWRWHTDDIAGWWGFGLAMIIVTPIMLAHILALPVWLSYLGRPKYLGRRILSKVLSAQVKRLRQRHKFKIVGVVGSVGKTSTKAAIAKTLGPSKRVLWQEGNYNVDVTVPLVLFGQPLPSLFNIFAWVKIWARNQQTIRHPYPYDVVVLELGTDGPGQIADFAYLEPDIVVVTAITPEHMEYFGTIDEVAKEELAALEFAKVALVNIDDVDARYLQDKTYVSYGLSPKATYYAGARTEKGIEGQTLTFYVSKDHKFTATIPVLGAPGAKMATAAVAVAHLLGEPKQDIEAGISAIAAFSGRMRLFTGIKESTLVDDTYNASPIAVKAALDVMYTSSAPQKIAILGSMNELGDYSPDAHREVGAYCDPKYLDLVVTIGTDAEKYLAPEARKKGCEVHSFASPYAAGAFVKKNLMHKGLVLAKGSQNRVFAEEALKCLLANKADSAEFVRQSNAWLAVKREQFADYR